MDHENQGYMRFSSIASSKSKSSPRSNALSNSSLVNEEPSSVTHKVYNPSTFIKKAFYQEDQHHYLKEEDIGHIKDQQNNTKTIQVIDSKDKKNLKTSLKEQPKASSV